MKLEWLNPNSIKLTQTLYPNDAIWVILLNHPVCPDLFYRASMGIPTHSDISTIVLEYFHIRMDTDETFVNRVANDKPMFQLVRYSKELLEDKQGVKTDFIGKVDFTPPTIDPDLKTRMELRQTGATFELGDGVFYEWCTLPELDRPLALYDTVIVLVETTTDFHWVLYGSYVSGDWVPWVKKNPVLKSMIEEGGVPSVQLETILDMITTKAASEFLKYHKMGFHYLPGIVSNIKYTSDSAMVDIEVLLMGNEVIVIPVMSKLALVSN